VFLWPEVATAYAPLPDIPERVDNSFTHFGYDPNGNLTSVNDGSDPQVAFAYDALSRRTNMTDGVGTTAWTYDPLSRLTSENGPFNQAVMVGYDALGRLTNIAYGGYTWLYGYDGIGRIISIDAPEGSYSLLYHQNGFNPSLVTYPNGITADRDYDALSRLENLDYSLLFDVAYAHDANDRRTNESWSTGRAIAYGYDDAGQLLSAVSTARPSDNAAYVYDEAGNPLRRTELGIGVTNAFNNLNQQFTSTFTGGATTVVGEVNYPAGTVTVNNVTAELHGVTFEAEGLSLSAGTNEFTAVYIGPAFTNTPMVATDIVSVVVGDVDYGFDLNGNLTNDAVFAYQYDAANRLTNVVENSSGDSVLAARYDGLGRRVEVTRNETNTERYVYLPGTFMVLAVLDATNGVKEVYTHGPDLSGTLGGAGLALHRAGGSGAGGIGGILAVTLPPSSDTRYFHSDAMGNIVAVSDENGEEAATYTYAPFGRVLSHTGEFDARFQFSSKEFDAETGLLAFGYRYYAPTLGRWLSRDIAGEFIDENLYRFSYNKPLLYSDPTGLWGVQFGSVNLGIGNPTLAFDTSSLGDLARGAKNVGRGFGQGAKGVVDTVRFVVQLGTDSEFRANIEAALGEIIDDPCVRQQILEDLKNGVVTTFTDEDAFGEFAGEFGFGVATVGLGNLFRAGKVGSFFGKVRPGKLPRTDLPSPRQGQKVFRVFGEKNKPFGESFTPVDPRTVKNFRAEAGLPDVNTGRFVLEGRIKNPSGITVRQSLPLDDNPGGLPEFLIPDAQDKIILERVSGVNPEF